MSVTTLKPSVLREFDREELRDERRHIRDLIFLRHLLIARGASAADLRSCDRVINEARGRLADLAKQASRDYAVAA
jgi:hypothetical protein